VILAADERTTDGALGAVVVEWDQRIVDEQREALPVGDCIRGRFSDRKRLEHGLAPKPSLELGDHL
jgi:hypothetical protein